jgi:hypothetical protein
MNTMHIVIPPNGREEADLIVTLTNDGIMTVHEFDGHGYEAHTAVPRYFGNMDLWGNWSTNERVYTVD